MAIPSQKWLIPALLLALLATGLFLRAYALDAQSFWLDEAISTNAAIAILEKGPSWNNDVGHALDDAGVHDT